MALKSIIYKVNLQVSDMDRNYFGQHTLMVARHPSETDERVMVRLLAFACNASPALSFGRGLSSDDEADIWEKDLTGSIELWIDVGLPDEKLIRKASGRAKKVLLYTYGGRTADMWHLEHSEKLAKIRNLSLLNIPSAATQQLALLTQKSMDLQCTIQDGAIWFSVGEDTVHVEPLMLQSAL